MSRSVELLPQSFCDDSLPFRCRTGHRLLLKRRPVNDLIVWKLLFGLFRVCAGRGAAFSFSVWGSRGGDWNCSREPCVHPCLQARQHCINRVEVHGGRHKSQANSSLLRKMAAEQTDNCETCIAHKRQTAIPLKQKNLKLNKLSQNRRRNNQSENKTAAIIHSTQHDKRCVLFEAVDRSWEKSEAGDCSNTNHNCSFMLVHVRIAFALLLLLSILLIVHV